MARLSMVHTLEVIKGLLWRKKLQETMFFPSHCSWFLWIFLPASKSTPWPQRCNHLPCGITPDGTQVLLRVSRKVTKKSIRVPCASHVQASELISKYKSNVWLGYHFLLIVIHFRCTQRRKINENNRSPSSSRLRMQSSLLDASENVISGWPETKSVLFPIWKVNRN